jgi:hypothetical protein
MDLNLIGQMGRPCHIRYEEISCGEYTEFVGLGKSEGFVRKQGNIRSIK